MEIVIDLLVLLVVVQTSLRLSQWTNGWLRIAFCVALGIAVWLCTDCAAELSKLQMAAWLHDTSMLQNIAIICLLDALFTFSLLHLFTFSTTFNIHFISILNGWFLPNSTSLIFCAANSSSLASR